MSWLESAARWSVRLPRGALRAPALRMRQPARALADEPEQRQPGPGRERDEASVPRPLFSCEPPLDCQGPCPPPPECPCPPPPPPPALLRFASAFFWWTGRAALGASLVYWTYVYGLWGSSDDTKAIVDQWRKAVGFTKQAGAGLWLGLSKLWDGGVKAVFSVIALGLQYMMGPGVGTEKPRHQTAEVAKEPERDDDDDELAPCGCCKRKWDAAERDPAG
ncbi:uncharacterized protein LOC126336100 [Schistocerca gregaria]|uniref:uncharacterized protein LOC126336100 n=1 Tax=Schistocerca gregaria TaxID=7010 RepID=UPI00211EAA44|nr:uncharacterized protein LOC126336100 [Schistocerca gregaria]